jgi:tight adherence protein B
MGLILNLFTLLVFLLVLTGFYTARALSRRQRRSEVAAARLQKLREQVMQEAGTDLSRLSSTTADSILLPTQDDLFPAWPWLGAQLGRLRQNLTMLGWTTHLRRRLLLTGGAAFFAALMLGRMTPPSVAVLVTLLAMLVLFVVIFAVMLQSALSKHLALLGRSLPEAIDAITRICRAGVPLHSAFAIAADHLQGPLVEELRQVDHWLKLGVPIRQVMQDSARRVPVDEYRFFAVILIISQESGGRLGDTLERLSATLRARAELQMKVMSKTSEARASTKIVALLVPGVLLYMYLNAPEDFRFMLSDPAGVKVMVYAAISVGLGLLITHLMVRRIS